MKRTQSYQVTLDHSDSFWRLVTEKFNLYRLELNVSVVNPLKGQEGQPEHVRQTINLVMDDEERHALATMFTRVT